MSVDFVIYNLQWETKNTYGVTLKNFFDSLFVPTNKLAEKMDLASWREATYLLSKHVNPSEIIT